MTSKDRVRRELEDISGELLGDLTPETRIRLLAEARAGDDDDRIQWLRETIPKREYRGVDPAYRTKALVAMLLSQGATYGLHMSYMEYRVAEARVHQALLETLLLPFITEKSPFEEASIDPEAILDYATERARTAGTGHYIQYHATKRFADECLGLELEVFLAFSSPGWLSDVEFNAVVERLEAQNDIADPVVIEADDGTTETVALDDAVDTLYESLVENWQGEDESQNP